MHRGAQLAVVYGVARIRHDLAIKPPDTNKGEKRTRAKIMLIVSV